MDVEFPKPGKYVVAVSGGVDSVVLLDLLSQRPDLELVVAHFDHGIRPDSAEDEKFVRQLADKQGLPYVSGKAELGQGANEAMAREARYEFLRKAMEDSGADAIFTAHHLDDKLETAILNMLRGTRRKGLTALKSQDDIWRPLLRVSKVELQDYARQQRLEWREDSTNQDDKYLRNYVRHNIVPKLDKGQKADLLATLTELEVTNRQLDDLLNSLVNNEELDRRWFVGLSHDVAREVMAAWLRRNGLRDFDKKGIERLVVAAKTGRAGSRTDVLKGVSLEVGKDRLALLAPSGL